MPLEPYKIKAIELGMHSRNTHEWRDILCHRRASAHQGVGPNPYELVNTDQSSNHRIIPDMDMARQGCSIGHNDMISDLAVMGHMGIGHQEIMIPDDGLP